MTEKILEVEDLNKFYVNKQVLHDISFSLNKGEVFTLLGPSGSGKSTILTIAAGLQRASDGQVVFEGNNMTSMNQEEIRKIRATDFGFVFQSAHLVPFLTVEEQLMLMLDVSESPLKKHERKKEIDKVLKLIDMEHRKEAYPASLSGGERQRVSIARAIIHKPKMLFADEPTASLDSKRSKDVMTLIRELTKTLNITSLMVTHDEEMLSYVDHIITMKDGRVL